MSINVIVLKQVVYFEVIVIVYVFIIKVQGKYILFLILEQ